MITLKFSENKLEHVLNIKARPHFIIHSIMVNSLYGQDPNLWSGKMMRLEPIIEVKFPRYNNRMNGFIAESLYIDAFNTPYHRHPIFDIKRVYPSIFEWREEDIKGIYECHIKLQYKPQLDVKPEITLLIETSEGITVRSDVASLVG